MISESEEKSKPLNIKLLLIAIVLLGLLLLAYDYHSTQNGFAGIIPRNDAGGRDITESLELDFLNQEQEMEVEVSAKGLSQKQIEEAFRDATKEIDKTYLGTNSSADSVSNDLILKDYYANGLVQVEWNFDYYGYISDDGKLNEEKIPDEGQLITITALMYCQDNEEIYSFCVVVVPKSLDTLEGQINAITDAVKEQNEKTLEDDNLILPTKVANMDITWKRKMDYRGLQLIILGVICVAAVSFGKSRDSKKEKEQIIEAMDLDYPMIVSELSILMGAGMSFRKALERIVSKYVSKSISRAACTSFSNSSFFMIGSFQKMLPENSGQQSCYICHILRGCIRSSSGRCSKGFTSSASP